MIIDCKKISDKIREGLKREIATFGRQPRLTIISVGDDPASQVYLRNKKRACEEVGIVCNVVKMPESSTTTDVVSRARTEVSETENDCLMVQLPMPPHIDEKKVLDAIPEEMDVEGLSTQSQGKFYSGREIRIVPCTPKGIINILKKTIGSLSGLNCVIIGRSNIVGKPLATLLTNEDATVTLCHSKTKFLSDITKHADVVVVAVGKPGFLAEDMVSDNAVVIDVGINRDSDGKLCGDVHPDVLKKVRAATPVPGGVGIMTVTSLLENVVATYY